MVGQPAEEGGAGAAAMLKDGLFTRFPVPTSRSRFTMTIRCPPEPSDTVLVSSARCPTT